ncbi:MAG TPA: MarR family winged helix-turn-helix transcriptional regulator [Pseudonocardiaceae bacterium]|nr:MarR family winged helix-turn-helix transcriptional regulator [Pseudonocardiaceae bacterium]
MTESEQTAQPATGHPQTGQAESLRRARTVEAVRALARASRLLERASGELSLAHYRVLSAIAAGDERASRVAERLALGKPAVSAAVESLSQRGLLTRSGVAGDQRAAALRLTEQGRALLDNVETDMINRMADLQARTPDGDKFLEVLGWLGAAIEEAAEERMTNRRGSGSGR